METEEFTKVVEVISQDLCMGKDERGILLVAGPRPELIRQILSSFEIGNVPSKKIYILGKKAVSKFDAKNVLIVSAEDRRLDSSHILIYLKDSGAYALMTTSADGNLVGFNTSDEVLVETLFEKIQDMYMIQGTF